MISARKALKIMDTVFGILQIRINWSSPREIYMMFREA
jgi:hypothetical protein